MKASVARRRVQGILRCAVAALLAAAVAACGGNGVGGLTFLPAQSGNLEDAAGFGLTRLSSEFLCLGGEPACTESYDFHAAAAATFASERLPPAPGESEGVIRRSYEEHDDGGRYSFGALGDSGLRVRAGAFLFVEGDAEVPAAADGGRGVSSVEAALGLVRDDLGSGARAVRAVLPGAEGVVSAAPGTVTGGAILRGGAGTQGSNTLSYSVYGVWALQYAASDDGDGAADSHTVGVVSYGLTSPLDLVDTLEGSGAYVGRTAGYVATLAADDAAQAYLLSGNATVNVNFRSDLVSFEARELLLRDLDGGNARPWHGVDFSNLPLDGVRYGASNVNLQGVTGAPFVTLSATSAELTPAVGNIITDRSSGSFSFQNAFIDGWFYGPVAPDPASGVRRPRETGGVWGVDATNVRVRASFGGTP